MRIRKKLYEIIFFILSILVTLIILEMGIRLFDPLGISYLIESSKYHSDKLEDPDLIYKHSPNKKRVYQGVEVSINDMGLRERKIEKKQPGRATNPPIGRFDNFRVGVPFEATFGQKLESLLSSRLDLFIRTINAGVGGYNTVQEYTFLKKYGVALEPDMIVLLYVTNDIDIIKPSAERSKSSIINKMRKILGKIWLYRFGYFTMQKFKQYNNKDVFDKNADGVRQSLEALTGIADFCRNQNIGFFTFFYGGKKEAMSSNELNKSEQLLAEIRELGNKYGFYVDDVRPWWGDGDMRSMTNSIVDPHPNERGHEVLAHGIADFLMKNDLIRKKGLFPVINERNYLSQLC